MSAGRVAKRGWGGGWATAMAAGVCVCARATIEDHVVETVLTRPDLTFVVQFVHSVVVPEEGERIDPCSLRIAAEDRQKNRSGRGRDPRQ